MSKLLRNGTGVAALAAALWMAGGAKSQPPVKIPSSTEEQVENLQLQVRDLQQALAKLQQQVSALRQGNNRVTAPFEVVNKKGDTIVSVNELAGIPALFVFDAKGRAAVSLDLLNGVGSLHLYDGESQVGSLSVNSGGGGATLSLSSTKGAGPTNAAGSFMAGTNANGDGYALAVGKNEAATSIGADSGGFVGIRAYPKWGGPPSAGMTIQADGSGLVYAGKPGSMRAKMAVTTTNGEGVVEVVSADDKTMSYLGMGSNGGEVGVYNPAGNIVAAIYADPKTKGGLGAFGDSTGTQKAIITAKDDGTGDVCIARGDKPDKCFMQTVLPLSIGR